MDISYAHRSMMNWNSFLITHQPYSIWTSWCFAPYPYVQSNTPHCPSSWRTAVSITHHAISILDHLIEDEALFQFNDDRLKLCPVVVRRHTTRFSFDLSRFNRLSRNIDRCTHCTTDSFPWRPKTHSDWWWHFTWIISWRRRTICVEREVWEKKNEHDEFHQSVTTVIYWDTLFS
jgi:hypothetical protein